MASAFSAARKDRLDLSVGIALGSASQIAELEQLSRTKAIADRLADLKKSA